MKNIYEIECKPFDSRGWEVADFVNFEIEMPDHVNIEAFYELKPKIFERLCLEYCRIYGYHASSCVVKKISKKEKL